MTCGSCGAAVQAGAHFCGGCGAAQSVTQAAPKAVPAPATCVGCGAMLAEGAGFCAACGRASAGPAGTGYSAKGGVGAPVRGGAPAGSLVERYQEAVSRPAEPEPTPEALAAYESLFAKLGEDGVIDSQDAAYLEGERRRLGVPSRHHARLMSGVFDGVPATLRFDIGSAHFVVGERAQVMLELRPNGQQFVQRFEVWYRTTILDRALTSYESRGLGSRPCEFSLTLEPPKVAGGHKLDGLLVIEFITGKVLRAEFELPPLKFDPPAGTGAPQSLSINVDASNTAAGQLNVGNAFAGPARTYGGVQIGTGQWHEIPLRTVGESDAARWLERNGGKAPPAAPRPPVGTPLRCRGIYLNAWRPNERPQEVWWLREDRVVFGRFHEPSSNPDLELLLEPRSNRQNEEQNAYLSRQHLAVQRTDRGIVIDGLSGGQRPSTVDGRPLAKGDTTDPLPTASLGVVPGLTVAWSSWKGADGTVEVVHGDRQGNVEQRTYLLAGRGVGLWPERSVYLSLRVDGGASAPVALVWHEGAPAMQNVSHPNLSCDKVRVGIGEVRYLAVGQLWTMGTLTVEVTDEVVREKA